MKDMKGRFLKKLKIIPTINSLKQGHVVQINHHQHNFSNQNCHSLAVHKDQDCKSNIHHQKHEEIELECDAGEKENITPWMESIVKNDRAPEEREDTDECPSLTDFEENCPPGGEESVIFYTTSMRGIRKTFEDCSSVRFLLDSFKVLVHERDVSMDKEFREELWRILGGRVIPPKLFIKGRYIGGADEVVGLHEQGKLKKLLEGIPSGLPNRLCAGCANMRFLVCSNCNGSRKVYAEKEGTDHDLSMKCPQCNENGLVKCPVCS